VSDHAALPTREAIVATAAETIAKGSKSFAAASRLFDRKTRERAWLLYAWCRACDDIADGQELGHGMERVEDGPARLALIREATAKALAGEVVGDPAFDALRIVAAETQLPHRMANDLIEGFALDARDWRPRTEADLLTYCYHVAGVVGEMMAVVMGVDPADEATLARACDLGLAFQLANIARDIEEDGRVGRCYLPIEWLVEMDMAPGDHFKPWNRQRLAVLARRLARMAERYEASARVGAAKLPFRSAWAVLSAAHIYGGIARKVAAAGEHAWDHRISTSSAEKLASVARAFGEAMNRGRIAQRPRDPQLWTPRRDVANG